MSNPNIAYDTGGWIWAADNGCFSNNWDADRWLAWLQRTAGSLFAVVPDVVGDAAATRERWDQWSATVVDTGHLPAYVLQDGQEDVEIPWDECAAVFVGGSTEFKLGDTAEQCVREARARGKWAHMGRVNSFKRLRLAASWGCNSADGTFLAFGPDTNVPRMVGWLHKLAAEPQLEGVA